MNEKPPPRAHRDLAKAQGLLRLNKALGGGHEDMARIMVMSNKYLKDDPDLSSLTVGLSSNGDFYDITKNRVGLTSSNADIFAHEVGHAKDLHSKSNFYKNIVLKGSKKLNRALDWAALPTATVLAAGPIKEENKSLAFKSLIGLSALSAIPNLASEFIASREAVGKSKNKKETFFEMLPGGLSHLKTDLTPAAKFMAVDTIRKNKDLRSLVPFQLLGTPSTLPVDQRPS